jgi:hypothetical protein
MVKKTMNLIDPYLISRHSFNESGDTFLKKFRCQYMGSAEYEFGAIPKSLKENVIDQLDDYQWVSIRSLTNFEDKCVHVFLHKSHSVEDYEDILQRLGESPYGEKIKCKELSYFSQNISKPDRFSHVDVWYDMDNGVIFTFEKHLRKHIDSGLLESKKVFDNQE